MCEHLPLNHLVVEGYLMVDAVTFCRLVFVMLLVCLLLFHVVALEKVFFLSPLARGLFFFLHLLPSQHEDKGSACVARRLMWRAPYPSVGHGSGKLGPSIGRRAAPSVRLDGGGQQLQLLPSVGAAA